MKKIGRRIFISDIAWNLGSYKPFGDSPEMGREAVVSYPAAKGFSEILDALTKING